MFSISSIATFLDTSSLELLEHWVKSVRIRSYSDPHFLAFGLNTERYGYFSVFSLNVGKCGKNEDQSNSEYGHFVRSRKQKELFSINIGT